jgi:hypothetical protein
MKREGTTSPSGGRRSSKMPAKDCPKHLKCPRNLSQVIRTRRNEANANEQETLKCRWLNRPGKAAFRKNIKAEVNAGKPVKQAVAIAYSVKRESAKKGKK